MASDGCGQAQAFSGFALSLTLSDETELDRAFAALAAGGEVGMPLGETFWSPRFGMVEDRFGVGWMLSLPVKPCGAESVAEDASRAVELVA
jgi:PhnB protein